MNNNMKLESIILSFFIIIVFMITISIVNSCINSEGKGIFFNTSSITEIWFYIIIFYIPIFIIKEFIGINKQKYLYKIIKAILKGLWFGLGFKSLQVLDHWYKWTDNGTYEPLFIILSISTASVIAIEKYLDS